MLLLDAFWRPLWVLRASVGFICWSFADPLDDFLASLEVLLGAVGCLGVPLGVLGGSWDAPGRLGSEFHDYPGNSGRSLGYILGSCLGCFRFVFVLRVLINV